jgi:hypothetical protein
VTQQPLILCADISFYLPTVHHGTPLDRARNGLAPRGDRWRRGQTGGETSWMGPHGPSRP